MDVGRNSRVVVLRGRREGHGRHVKRVVLAAAPHGVPVLLILLVQAGAVLQEGAVIRVDSVDGRRQATFVRWREMLAWGRWSGRKRV